MKILAKAMIKQIDRLVGDLCSQADQFHQKSVTALTVGIVGINFADQYVSHEGDCRYPTAGLSGNPHPIQEAKRSRTPNCLNAADVYDEFIELGFRANNQAAI